ncbi:MAG: T9SS type A sorting domain-containing protein, partial [Ignavibacteriales bacterium]|nr:T9SS type A sorting domain-containing protein [Ignavibacteriales bacterium]
SITNTDEEIISDYSLTNFPNPFNPTTRIEYQLPKAGFVTVKVYNALGKEVATLVNDRKDEGKYFVEFNGTDLSSGIYFCELRANEFVTMKKMLLVK